MFAKCKIFMFTGMHEFPDILEFQIARNSGNPEFVEIWYYGNVVFHISVISDWYSTNWISSQLFRSIQIAS